MLLFYSQASGTSYTKGCFEVMHFMYSKSKDYKIFLPKRLKAEAVMQLFTFKKGKKNVYLTDYTRNLITSTEMTSIFDVRLTKKYILHSTFSKTFAYVFSFGN